ncbi:DUF3253 domain-containing protein [Mycobacterium sp. NS-7484]|uniref:DUF3253 domain-containing protein n=1 Tax=Mycobacterium sp. NS-7484 TaxID=1834161 RepID=UPI003511D59B
MARSTTSSDRRRWRHTTSRARRSGRRRRRRGSCRVGRSDRPASAPGGTGPIRSAAPPWHSAPTGCGSG